MLACFGMVVLSGPRPCDPWPASQAPASGATTANAARTTAEGTRPGPQTTPVKPDAAAQDLQSRLGAIAFDLQADFLLDVVRDVHRIQRIDFGCRGDAKDLSGFAVGREAGSVWNIEDQHGPVQ